MAFNDGVKVGPIAYIGLLSVLSIVVLVMFLQVVYYQQRKSIDEANLAAQGPPHELTELESKQRDSLKPADGYVDRQQRTVNVGVERAKTLVLAELASGKPPSEVVGPKRSKGAPASESPKAEEGKPKVDAAETDETEQASDSPKVEPDTGEDDES